MITLTTDFGDSPYVGAMKGAILRTDPDARLVDVTHAVPPQDVRAGALALLAAAPHFPDGCVHVAVVDPGVGTARRGLCIVTRRALLVGPDNGLLIPAARALGLVAVHALENPRLTAEHVSPVFHGRDVFGPVAAHLARGVAPAEVGPRVASWVDLDFGPWARLPEGGVEGLVIAADPFGNLTTNVPDPVASDALRLGEQYRVRTGRGEVEATLRRTYGEAGPGEPLLLVGSSGFLELAVNQGSAAAALGARAGARVRVEALHR